jgi:hypothetical protein
MMTDDEGSNSDDRGREAAEEASTTKKHFINKNK